MDEIVWYPGHMAKAKRKIAEILPLIDVVIELIDARLPVSSRNPDFKEIFKNKPSLAVLTKTTLADRKETERHAAEISLSGTPCLQLDCKKSPDMKKVTAEIKKLVAEKLMRNEKKGVVKPVRCIVAGITNVGKSTFINTYTKTKKAKAEDRPGVTRQNFWISSPYGVELLDTPGLLWHKFDDKEIGIKLAAIGSVRDEILDINALACDTIGLIRKKYAPFIETRYKIKTEEEDLNINILEKIGKSRGFLISGGEIDLDRASVIFLDEFRAGKIGRMTLD
ncbi:MAG: ribosome biogenesis GTPase YlqF [Eubacteriales bacterium]|nr:ribosome biogenesis GTPase YlqF [Eubacteriales bacterium]